MPRQEYGASASPRYKRRSLIPAVVFRQDDGAAEGKAKLILLHRRFGGLEEIARVQFVVAQVLVQSAVERISAAARDGVDYRTASRAIAGAIVRCLHLDFFERFDHGHMGVGFTITEVDVERSVHEPTRSFVVH